MEFYAIPKDRADELYHYGVKGMKWGHRNARREVYKSSMNNAKNRMWDDRNKAESAHDKRQTAINKKYGQMGKNNNAHMNRKTKKAYERETKANWDRYVKEDNAASAGYKQAKKQAKAEMKQAKKQDKILEKQAKKEYKQRTSLTSDQKKVRAAAVVVTSLLASPLAGAAVAYGSTGYMRAKNDLKRQNKGKATVKDILSRF